MCLITVCSWFSKEVSNSFPLMSKIIYNLPENKIKLMNKKKDSLNTWSWSSGVKDLICLRISSMKPKYEDETRHHHNLKDLRLMGSARHLIKHISQHFCSTAASLHTSLICKCRICRSHFQQKIKNLSRGDKSLSGTLQLSYHNLSMTTSPSEHKNPKTGNPKCSWQHCHHLVALTLRCNIEIKNILLFYHLLEARFILTFIAYSSKIFDI